MSEQDETTTAPTVNGNHSAVAPWEEIAPPDSNQIVRRGFGGMELAGQGPATAALVARQRANIESRFIMAMHRPRSMPLVRQNILTECRRPGFAEEAIYHLPRGGKTIDGLSIRFAEVAVRCMTNIPVDTVTIFESDEERVVEVTATDLESNVTWSRQITVKKTVERKDLKRGQRALRERTNSYGDRVYIVEATDDEVTIKESAMVSKTARTLILRLIPGNLKDEAFQLCSTIARDKAAQDPDAHRNQMVDAFARDLNVSVRDLEEFFDSPIDKITAKQVGEMKPIYVSIRDGETTWKDVLAGRPTKAKTPAPATNAKPASAPVVTGNTVVTSVSPPPAQEPAKGGKGAVAVKSKLAADKAAAAETPEEKLARLAKERPTSTNMGHDPHPNAPPKSEPKTIAEPAPDIKPPPAPLTLVNPSADDWEMRECAVCSAEIEVRKTEPKGAQCESCANA